MLNFTIDGLRCTKCTRCMTDCPVQIIEMDSGLPFIKEDNEVNCMACQHCLAVCPHDALSIFGITPEECVPIKDAATSEAMDALIRNRRTVRRYKNKNVDPEKLEALFASAANAPTGKNTRTVQLHVIDDAEQMAIFREKVISRLEEINKKGGLTGGWEFFKGVIKDHRSGNDIVFRGAPHLVAASVAEESPTPDADGFILLSYMELMASSMKLGTVWLGFLQYIFQLAPDLKELLSIPKGQKLVYALLLGEPSVHYHRGVMRDKLPVSRIKLS